MTSREREIVNLREDEDRKRSMIYRGVLFAFEFTLDWRRERHAERTTTKGEEEEERERKRKKNIRGV